MVQKDLILDFNLYLCEKFGYREAVYKRQVCSIVMGAIYLHMQMVFRQLLSPTLEKCFMRFECYRNRCV